MHTPVSLLRFSALTSNAHKIHYSLPWCRDVEGHRNLVIRGPLNLIYILDLWRETRSGRSFELPKSIKYRATSAIYAEEPYSAILESKSERRSEVKLWTSDGKVRTEANIQVFD